jgi:hypothetical protein
MHPLKHWLLALLFLTTTQIAVAQTQVEADAQPVSIEDKVKNLELIDGFIDLYWDLGY